MAHWNLEARPAPTKLQPGKPSMIVVTVTNNGDEGTSGTTQITDKLPQEVEATKVETKIKGHHNSTSRPAPTCSKSTGSEVVCSSPLVIAPYEDLVLEIRVQVGASAPSGAPGNENEVRVSGGAPTAVAPLLRAFAVRAEQTSFGVESYELTPETEEFKRDEQAGSHPFQLTTTFNLNERFEREAGSLNEALPSAPGLQKNLEFKLPPGLIGNVNAVPTCSAVEFGSHGEEEPNACPNDTAVGVASATVNIENGLHFDTFTVPVFNLAPEAGEPARFGFTVDHVPVILDTTVRTGGDYGVTVSVHYTSSAVQVLGSTVTFWGVPADPRHNASRGWSCLEYGATGYLLENPCELNLNPERPAPFLLLPTSCGELGSTVEGVAWGGEPLVGEDGSLVVKGEDPTSLTGCGSLPFNPSVEVSPEQHEASTPTGLTVRVNVPQATTVESTVEGAGVAEADIEATTLKLPLGLQASPAAASGLATCSVSQAGFAGLDGDIGETLGGELQAQSFTSEVASCPPEAKIGTVNIKTPVLKEELTGAVYLASQDTNPFASPLVLYIIAEEPSSKVLVKLAGEVQIDASTGQLTSVFRNTPNSPFETLTLHLTNGERAAQSTPAFCGNEYSAKASFATWSAPSASTAAESSPSEFQITSGPGGTPCPGATLPFAPAFQAGSTNSQAAAFSPFTLTIEKPDGQQALESITAQLPPGLSAEIAAVTPCANPQAIEALPTLTPPGSAQPCGEQSLIGHTIEQLGPWRQAGDASRQRVPHRRRAMERRSGCSP